MKLIIVCAYYAKSALLQFGVVCIIIDGANITTTRTSFYAILTIIFGTNIRVIEPVVDTWSLVIVVVALNPSILYHLFFSVGRWLYPTNKSYLHQLNYNINQQWSWGYITTLLYSVWYANARVIDILQPRCTSTSEQSSDACTMDNIYRAPADLGRSYREYVGIMPYL